MRSKQWLAAGITLGRDPSATVMCPVCGIAELSVRDIYPTPDSEVFERYLECSNCEARNVLRMKLNVVKEQPLKD